MKRYIMLSIILIAGLVYSVPADKVAGIVEDYAQPVQPIISLPSDFNPDVAIQEMKLARKNGNQEKAALLSQQIHQWYLQNRSIELKPETNGSNPYPGPERRKEINKPSNDPAPLWGTDVRIDPNNEVYDVKIASLSNGHLYAIAVWDSSGSDHVLVKRSTNNGSTWTTYWNTDFGTSYEIYYPGIRIINDTIILWYVLHRNSDNTERNWFITCLPGSSFSAIYWGSPTGGYNPVQYKSLQLTDDSPIYDEMWLYATWVTWDTIGTDTTWVMFARSNELDVSNWELGPISLDYTVGTNIYFYDTRIAYGSNTDKMWLVAFLHPFGYPTIYDEGIYGWYSDNYGGTWSSSIHMTPFNNHYDEFQPAIAGAHNNTNWVLLATSADTSTHGNPDIYMWYSTNDGTNWTQSSWVVPYLEFLPDIYVDNQSTGFYGAFRQNTSSTEMVKYKFGAINDPTYWTQSIAINDNLSNNLSDVYGPSITRNMATGDAGIVWTDLTGGLYSIWFDAGGTGIAEGDVKPVTGIVMNIVPNPSNGVAKLSYTLKNPGSVNISIYDASGRLVNQTVNESKPAGTHTLNLTNQELPNGIYFVRIETPEGTATKAMTIVR